MTSSIDVKKLLRMAMYIMINRSGIVMYIIREKKNEYILSIKCGIVCLTLFDCNHIQVLLMYSTHQ